MYGSCDGGRTIRAESHEMNSKMALAAKILNIKGEYVQNADRTQRVFLHASCDVEGHLGRDGRYYIVGMLFPLVAIIELLLILCC